MSKERNALIEQMRVLSKKGALQKLVLQCPFPIHGIKPHRFTLCTYGA